MIVHCNVHRNRSSQPSPFLGNRSVAQVFFPYGPARCVSNACFRLCGGGTLLSEYTEVESGRKNDRARLAEALAACRLHRAASTSPGYMGGQPHDQDPWQWFCGFYPGSDPGEQRGGTAATFDQARVDFEVEWQRFSVRRTPADYQAWRDQRNWTARKEYLITRRD